MFTNNQEAMEAVCVKEAFCTSDHNVVTVQQGCPIPRAEKSERKVDLYTKGDYQEINKQFFM